MTQLTPVRHTPKIDLHPPTARRSIRTTSTIAAAIALAMLTASCAAEPSQGTNSVAPVTGHDTPKHEHEHEHGPTETATLEARIALTYDGGIKVLNAQTLEEVGDIPATGFTRLNAVGDNRHLAVSGAGGFSLLDLGTWSEAHGDHAHNYSQSPVLSDVIVAADKPGHVIPHGGTVAFYDDATGTGSIFDVTDLSAAQPESIHHADAAHHGFLIPRNDGTAITTSGTVEERNTVQIVDSTGQVIAETNQCPGVHGEATAAAETFTVGCEDGILVVKKNDITKLASPNEYGRIGNQSGTDQSPVVLGDYKTDPAAELERPTQISLTNTSANTLTIVDLPASYSFRSLARDESGAALVLGTDGAIHVIDPETGKLTQSIPVTTPWEEPTQWQAPRPAIFALDGSVYVTAPHEKRIYAVDIEIGKVWKEAELTVEPNEISGGLGG